MIAGISAAAPTIGAVLQEAAALARELEDSPLWRIANVREGAITIQQQAERFESAADDATRKDAAEWAREGYIILSSALPDTHAGAVPNERKTGWIIAHEIGRLFGPEFAWLARVRLAFTPAAPDASRHDPSTDYLRGLIAITGMSQRSVADRIGVSHRLLKYYLTTPGQGKEHRVAPYPVQFALEALARADHR